MNLGLPKDTLTKIFKIRNLPEGYVLPIPIYGSLRNPKIDKGQAAAEIAALLSKQSNNFGVNVFGGMLDMIKKNQEPAPPAKHPFPWEVQKP